MRIQQYSAEMNSLKDAVLSNSTNGLNSLMFDTILLNLILCINLILDEFDESVIADHNR